MKCCKACAGTEARKYDWSLFLSSPFNSCTGRPAFVNWHDFPPWLHASIQADSSRAEVNAVTSAYALSQTTALGECLGQIIVSAAGIGTPRISLCVALTLQFCLHARAND